MNARMGRNNTNLSGGVNYTADYTSRKQIELEHMYRSSFLVGAAVDMKAEDMTRKGVFISSGMDGEQQRQITQKWVELKIWSSLRESLQWGDLYGGAIAVILIDGQDVSKPLRLETVGKDQFKGLLVFNRWQIEQQENRFVTDIGPDYGKRAYYKLIPGQIGVPAWYIHYSRVIPFLGEELPYQQRLYENGWGQSVIERIIARIEAFDSVTHGIAQLIYKSHLRTYSIDKLRQLLAHSEDHPAYQGLMKHMEMIRAYQSIEGMTLMDKDDLFQTHTYSFGGLADVQDKFAEQIAGAIGVPLIRLLGQSPKGFSTGDADLSNYYDRINSAQEDKLRNPCHKLFEITYRSLFGSALPDDFNFEFSELWQMSSVDKSAVAVNTVNMLNAAQDGGLMSQSAAMSELKNQSRITGIGSIISEEDIDNAKDEPLSPAEYGEIELANKVSASSSPVRNSTTKDSKAGWPDRWGLRWFRSKRIDDSKTPD